MKARFSVAELIRIGVFAARFFPVGDETDVFLLPQPMTRYEVNEVSDSVPDIRYGTDRPVMVTVHTETIDIKSFRTDSGKRFRMGYSEIKDAVFVSDEFPGLR